MDDRDKTREQLLDELANLREQLSAREAESAEFDRIEQALEESEERYRLLVDSSLTGIYIHLDGRFVFVNERLAEMLLYSPEEMVGRYYWDFLHPDDVDAAKRIGRARDRGERVPSQYAFRVIRKNGQIKWFEAFVTRITYRGRTATMGNVADVTERREAEEELKREKQRLQALLEQAPFGMIMIGADGAFQYVNPRFTELFGYRLSDVPSGRDWFRKAHPDPEYRHKVIAMWLDDQTGAEPGERPSRVFTVTCKDGTEKVIHFRPVKMAKHQNLITCEDITEREKAISALRESEERFRMLSEASEEGIAIHDRGVILDGNEALARMFGYELSEMIGMNAQQCATPESWQTILKHIASGYDKPYEGVGVKKDGSTFPCQLVGKPFQFQGQTLRVAAFRDITELKRLEEQLRQAAKMEAIGRLAGGIAHDFNNLLTAVLGYSNILLQEFEEGTAQHNRLLQMTRAAELAAGLTRQLLAFSRKQVLDVKVLDLNKVISDLHMMLQRLIREDIQLVTVLEPSLGKIKVDPGQLEQIIINLVVNARDAMPGGGKLTIETENVNLDENYARSHSEVDAGAYVMVAVSDTGLGMDSETVSRIFDPFFTTKEKGVGTGLGLSTVYGIVKQHRGHVTVYSEPGHGTTFKIYLPQVQQASDDAGRRSSSREERRGDETILVVEDEEYVRNLVCEALTMLGYSLLCAADPKEAVALCRAYKGPIHLLLTDVILPHMDGKSLFQKMVSYRPGLKVLYVSGYTENFIVQHGVLDEGVQFMHKPFDIDSLAGKVRAVLDEA
jgi:two-component system cell cycle sensor histidine kinase/response regulator CckA